MHAGLGGETAALQAWDAEPSPAPLCRRLQQDWGGQSPPHGREVGGLSPPRDGEHLQLPKSFPHATPAPLRVHNMTRGGRKPPYLPAGA